MGRLTKHGAVLYKLSRTIKERWHLQRTMVTQLVEHERIKSTLTKCKALKPLAEKVMRYAVDYSKTKNEISRRKLQGILTTKYARNKAVREIAPRFSDRTFHLSRVVNLKTNRKGDCAPVGYIEYIWNDLEKYEKSLKKEKIEKGEIVDMPKFENKILKQEREFFREKLEKLEEDQKVQSIEMEQLAELGKIDKRDVEIKAKAFKVQQDFFKEKIRRVEHDIFIMNKNKYDIIKFPKQF